MFSKRSAHERGHFNFGWLDTYHTFSFGDYFDPQQMGFRSLRVINEDYVQPKKGFPTHPHQDMEIITYVLRGALEHKDSMGNGSLIKPGEIQRMSAGTGVTHSEFNPSQTEEVHLLQIWILPEKKGIKPSYEQKSFSVKEKHNKLRLVASPHGHEGSVIIHQDVELFISMLDQEKTITYPIIKNRHVWVQVARGSLSCEGHLLKAGDGCAVSDEEKIKLTATEASEVLLFSLV